MNTPQQTPTRVDVAIVGAGLCGLALADRLAAHGLETVLLEARNRPGGRVLSETAAGTPVDLGPAWIWPHNHRMRALLERLGLATFPQRAEGNLVFQDQAGRVRRDLTMATMAGSLRVAGGLGRVTEKLAEALPDGVLRLDHRVTAIRDGHVRQRGVILWTA